MDIVITVVVAVLTLLVEHWFPWEKVLGKKLPRLVAYVLGVLALVVPLSGLFLWWYGCGNASGLLALLALWAVVSGGGIAVVIAWWLDDWLDKRRSILEGDERERALMEKLLDDQDDE